MVGLYSMCYAPVICNQVEACGCLPVLRLCIVFTIGKSPRACSKYYIVTDITFYRFEVRQKLVRTTLLTTDSASLK